MDSANSDRSMKRMAVAAIIIWAIVGSVILKSPALLAYIALHACVTGVFLFFFLRKESEARKAHVEKELDDDDNSMAA